MSKEDYENTSNVINRRDSKHESSDSDNSDEIPTEVCRKVLAENLISPTTSSTRALPSDSINSSPPKINNTASGHQRQSASSSHPDQSLSVEIDSNIPGPSTLDLRTSKTVISEVDDSMKTVISDAEPSAYTAVKVVVPSNSSDPRDPPLVFLSSTGYEEEMSSSQERGDHNPGDLAADILLSDASSKQVPSSAESEDSDDVGLYDFPNQSSRQFATPEALEKEIRSVFEMISTYVKTEINKKRTKRDTLQKNLRRRRTFIRYPLSHTVGQFSAVSQRIATHLLSTLTDQEGLEFTYQGPPQISDQLPFHSLIQESAQCFGHGFFGISSVGSYGGCCQQASEAQEPLEELTQALPGREVPRSTSESHQASSTIAPSSSSRRTAEVPSGVVTYSELGPEEISELAVISTLFSRGYNRGLEIGSENYAQRGCGRLLQIRFGQMIQNLQQRQEAQTPGIPQDLLDFAIRMIFVLCPQTTHWLNTLVPRTRAQAYYIGLFSGFSRAYSRWLGRRPVFYLSSRSVPRLFYGLSPNQHRELYILTQRSLQEAPIGTQQGSSLGFPNTSAGHSQSSSRRAIRNSTRRHRSEPPSPRSSGQIDQETSRNFLKKIHLLLTQLVLDLNMIQILSDLISKEYRGSHSRDFDKISGYLLCFEIMREDLHEKEYRYVALESIIANDVQRHRREAFAILHIELLIGILENSISRFQYGVLLVRTHQRLGEVGTLSDAIKKVARTAMSYEMWTKED